LPPGGVVDPAAYLTAEDEFQQKIHTGKITDVSKLDGGISETFKGHVTTDKVFMRTDSGIDKGIEFHGMRTGTDNTREMAAQIVNRAMGLPVVMPRAVYRDLGGGMGKGLITEFMPGSNISDLAKEAGREYHVREFQAGLGASFKEQKDRMLVFDAVIGNIDRHTANMMWDGKSLYAIDNGLSFPYGSVAIKRVLGGRERLEGPPSAENMKYVKRISDQRESVSKALKAYLNQAEIDGLWVRVDNLLHPKPPNSALAMKGGEGSGNFGHAGRPGLVGGSAPEGTPASPGPIEGEGQYPPEMTGYQPPPETALEKEMKAGPIEDIQILGGGISDTFTGTIHGTMVKLVPDSGHGGAEHIEFGFRYGADNKKEMAAQIINDAMGGLVNAPRTVQRDDVQTGPVGRKSPGIVQEFFQGAYTFQSTGLAHDRVPEKDAERMNLFDSIIGNTDRHENNFMVTLEHGKVTKLLAIDHGLSFPTNNRFGGPYGNIELLDRMGVDLSVHSLTQLKMLRMKKETLTPHLKKYLIDDEINAMWERVDTMLTKKQIPI